MICGLDRAQQISSFQDPGHQMYVPNWLHSSPEKSSDDPNCKEGAAFVTTVPVSNGVAEGEVKLITDFLETLTNDVKM